MLGSMKLHSALAEALVAEGTEVVFGLMGDANMYLVVDLVERLGVRYIAVRHEQAAVMAADAYSRATGRPGVCTVTMGPGLTHTATALTVARHNRSQVVLVAGDTPVADRLNVQNFEQQPFAMATAGAFQRVRTAETLAEDVCLAFRHVRLGRGPIVLDVGMDLQAQDRPEGFQPLPSLQTLPEPQLATPDPARLEAVTKILANSSRPLVLAGRGAFRAGAKDALIALADRLGAPLTTSLGAKGLFAGHPYAVGVTGGFATDLTREVVGRADCVLAFGATLNRWTMDQGKMFAADARLVQVVTDVETVGDFRRVDEAVLADARTVAEALLAVVEPGGGGWRDDALRERIATEDPLAQVELVDDAHGLDPRAVLLAVNRLLPARRQAVIGIGHFGGWFGQHLTVTEPGTLFTPWEFGSIGVGVPFGLGVAAANPDTPTVVFEGDGSLLQMLGELDTAVRAKLPLLVIVMDDGAYGAEIHKFARLGVPIDLCLFDSPDFAAVARGLGMEARTVSTTDGLEQALSTLGPITAPTLLHVRISREVNQRVF